LVDACSEALYEFEGIDKGVSRRSIQMDIQMMRSEKLGYNAPIIVLDKKYYTYEDPEYSITNIPLTDQDIGKLTEVVEILKQFKGFSHFQELSGMVQRLENKIHSAKTNQEPVIDFEKNENLKGLEYIDTVYQAIVNKQVIKITYQSFRAREQNSFPFHAYYLKEYRNRWFVLGVQKRNGALLTLALDRIISIEPSELKYVQKQNFDLNTHLQHVVGVTVNPDQAPVEVTLLADHQTAPYIITKPIHHSQKQIEVNHEGVTFSLMVQINFELERELLGFGNRVKVLSPESLKKRIKKILEEALEQYQYEFSEAAMQHHQRKLAMKGSSVIHHVYSSPETGKMKRLIDSYLSHQKDVHAIRHLLVEIPELKTLIFNRNFRKILKSLNKNLFLTKAIFFDKNIDANWAVQWHQDIVINVSEKIDDPEFTGWTKKPSHYGVVPPEDYLKSTYTIRIHLDDTNENNGALKILPGSHHQKMTDEQIVLLAKNSTPAVVNVDACGIHIMRPLLLHASSKSTGQKRRRVLHLEFNDQELPAGTEWAERLDFKNMTYE